MTHRGKNAISTIRRNESFLKVAPDKEVEDFYKRFVQEHGESASLVYLCNTLEKKFQVKKEALSVFRSRKLHETTVLKENSLRKKSTTNYRLKTEAGTESKAKDLERTKAASFAESLNSRHGKIGPINNRGSLKPMPKPEETISYTERSNPIFSSSQKINGLAPEATSPKSIASNNRTKTKPSEPTERTHLSPNHDQSHQHKSRNNLRDTNGSIESKYRTGLFFNLKNKKIDFAPLAQLNNLNLQSLSKEDEKDTQLFLKK